MYTIIYLSPTGNTLYLVKKLQEQLNISNDKLFPLEFTDPKQLKKDEDLILMFSIHGFNPPRTVKRFIKSLPKELFNNVHIIAVGCNTSWVNDSVSQRIRKSLIKKGYNVVVNETLAMPLTLVMKFPKDLGRKLIDESTERISKIAIEIKETNTSNCHIKLKSKIISAIGKIEDPASRLFGLELHANKKCISCALCWNNCPENNIKPNKNNHPKFGLKCMMCMRCIDSCPTHAISPYISKFLLTKNGYSLEEYLGQHKNID